MYDKQNFVTFKILWHMFLKFMHMAVLKDHFLKYALNSDYLVNSSCVTPHTEIDDFFVNLY